MVSGSVALPCPGFFSPFPHGTGPLSVSREYLALPDGPGRFTQDSSCPALLRMPRRFARLRVRGSHPLRPGFPDGSARRNSCLIRGPTTPRPPKRTRFGLLPVRSPLLGESLLFSSPAGTKMFQFPAFASTKKVDDGPSGRRVVPFGNPRIKGHLLLPAAYRSLSRPSSPPRAQASAMCPFLLSLSPWPASPPAGIIYFRLDFSFLSYLCFLLLVHNVIDRTPLARNNVGTVGSHHASCSLPLSRSLRQTGK